MNNKNFLASVVLVFFTGTLLRFFVAFFFFGSHEVIVFTNVLHSFAHGVNIYATSRQYPYPNLFLEIFYTLTKLFPTIPEYFILKLPIIIGDVMIGASIYLVTKELNILPRRRLFILCLFFLNPVSILTTSFNASFGNICLALFGFVLYYISKSDTRWISGIKIAFIYALSLSIKQMLIIFSPLLFFIQQGLNKVWIILVPVITLFFILFLYIRDISKFFFLIWNAIFLYSGFSGQWGYTQLISNIQHGSFEFFPVSDIVFNVGKVFLIAVLLMCGFFLSRLYPREENTSCKLSFLYQGSFFYFLTFFIFTPGFGSDYYSWIIPISAVASPLFTIVYSSALTIAISRAINEIYILGGFSPIQAQIHGMLNYIPYIISIIFFLYHANIYFRRLLKYYSRQHRGIDKLLAPAVLHVITPLTRIADLARDWLNEKSHKIFVVTTVIVMVCAGASELYPIISRVVESQNSSIVSRESIYDKAGKYLRNRKSEETVFVWGGVHKLYVLANAHPPLFDIWSSLTLNHMLRYSISHGWFTNYIATPVQVQKYLTKIPPTFIVLVTNEEMISNGYSANKESFDFISKHYNLEGIFGDIWIYHYNIDATLKSADSKIGFPQDQHADFVSLGDTKPSGNNDVVMYLKGIIIPVNEIKVVIGDHAWHGPMNGVDSPIVFNQNPDRVELFFEPRGFRGGEHGVLKIFFVDGTTLEKSFLLPRHAVWIKK